MKIYAKIESRILFIDEKDEQELIEKYQEEYSITTLEKFEFCDGNILKIELLKSKALKGYNDFLRY